MDGFGSESYVDSIVTKTTDATPGILCTLSAILSSNSVGSTCHAVEVHGIRQVRDIVDVKKEARSFRHRKSVFIPNVHAVYNVRPVDHWHCVTTNLNYRDETRRDVTCNNNEEKLTTRVVGVYGKRRNVDSGPIHFRSHCRLARSILTQYDDNTMEPVWVT